VPAVIRADGLTSSEACGRRGRPDAAGACCAGGKWGEWRSQGQKRRTLFTAIAALAGAAASFLKKRYSGKRGPKAMP